MGTLVERVQFDGWSKLAIEQRESGGLYVVRSQFGMNTGADAQFAESIIAFGSSGLTIEKSAFGFRRGSNDVIDLNHCNAGARLVVADNLFVGGEDDAIDLDDCSAFVIGNYIRNFRPDGVLTARSQANGGGITGSGEGSRPILINNIIDSCYHGIGFKDGARPTIVNNTIINNNIGVTLYKSLDNAPEPSAVMINNLLWNNRVWPNGAEPNDLVLNGRWWPRYSQESDVQASIDARYNIIASDPFIVNGDYNWNVDPLLQIVTELPIPMIGSPAIDSGIGVVPVKDAQRHRLAEFLAVDFCGNSRKKTGERFIDVDRGAIEASRLHSATAICPKMNDHERKSSSNWLNDHLISSKASDGSDCLASLILSSRSLTSERNFSISLSSS